MSLTSHPFIRTLIDLRGNARACVYTEPLWGIPYNLYAPYTSIFMLTLGIKDSQIGLVASIGITFQIFWTLMSGAITDKLGRKRATLMFDLISWSIPCLIWAFSQNFTHFLIAAIINAMYRVPHNSWNCLLVEDTDPRLLVDIYSWVYISGQIVAVVSPLASVLIAKFTLVPTIRGLYLLAFVMMTAKFLVLNAFATETRQGVIRMEATRHQPLFAVLREMPDVLRQILQTPATLFTAGLMMLTNICWMISNTFWSIFVTEKLHIPAKHLAYYYFARSLVMLLFFFFAMPKLRNMDVRKPLLAAFSVLILSQIALINVPHENYALLLFATILEACSVPIATTFVDKLTVITINPKERARIMAILWGVMLVFTSPFGWIAGQLSEMNRSLPFILNIILFALGALLSLLARSR
ncbi:putative major facilitator superfamily transporter [Candidatus Moduliflexus flocculans]|uniref:Putative major facilitator superfamily transporter n=1 Tax=Candidatus Moduliflexus flocculans TaxID=1499966 RepID=A0A0S6VQP2_9BACT|nr:putative major facilitator superfamily transporter [Candidatus Moduliflexus flocculans]